jgi:hypothetical protein
MSTSRITVPTGVVAQRVGKDLMVLVPGRAEVVTLTGEAAEVFLDIQAGRAVHARDDIVSGLDAQGVIEIPGVSRRGLIKAGAIGAGAGIAVLSMPNVAAAASSSPIDGEASTPFEGEAYWAWVSSGSADGTQWEDAAVTFTVYAASDIFTTPPSALTIPGTIPAPTELSGTTASPIPLESSGLDFATWRGAFVTYVTPDTSPGDPLEFFAPTPENLTGTFSIPGVGPFTTVFSLSWASL